MTSWSTPHPNWKLDRTHQHKLFSSSPAQWHFDQGSDGASPIDGSPIFWWSFSANAVRQTCMCAGFECPQLPLQNRHSASQGNRVPLVVVLYVGLTWRSDIVSCRKLEFAESNNKFQVCFVSSYRLLLSACSRRLVDWASVLLHTHSFPSQSYSA